MAIDTVTITEDIDLESVLEKFPNHMKRTVLRDAVKAAAKIVQKAAKARAPVGDPSHKPHNKPLAKSIGLIIKRYSNDEKFMAIVGPQRPAGAHGHLLEGGHDIFARGPKGVSYRNEGVKPLTGKTRAAARAFMVPAIDATRKAVDVAVIESIDDALIAAGL